MNLSSLERVFVGDAREGNSWYTLNYMNPYSDKPYVVDVQELKRTNSTQTDSIFREVWRRVAKNPLPFISVFLVLVVAQSLSGIEQFKDTLTEYEFVTLMLIAAPLALLGMLGGTVGAVLLFSEEKFGNFVSHLLKGSLWLVVKGIPFFLLLFPYYIIAAVGFGFFAAPQILQSFDEVLRGIDTTSMALIGGVVFVISLVVLFFLTIRSLFFVIPAVLGMPRPLSTSIVLTRNVFWRTVLHWVLLMIVTIVLSTLATLVAGGLTLFGASNIDIPLEACAGALGSMIWLGYLTVLFETRMDESEETLPLLHRDVLVYYMLGGIGVIAGLFLVFGFLVG